MTDTTQTHATASAIPWVGVAAALAICLAAFPFLAHTHLPLIDLPNHMARHYIAASSGTALDSYYSYTFSMKGNSAGDILWLGLGRHLFDVYSFSTILMALYGANLVASAMVLGRVMHGRWTIWPLASILVLYNAPLFWGFQNFLLTVPLALYALALWLASEDWPPLRRVLVFLPIAWLLHQLHVLGFALLMLTAFGREVHRVIAAGRDWGGTLARNLVLAIPFLPPLVMALATASGDNEYGNRTLFGGLGDRIEMLASTMAPASEGGSTALEAFAIAAAIALGAAALTLRRTTGPRLTLSSKAVGPLVVLGLVCLIAPIMLSGVALVHIRFPFVVVLLFLAGTAWRDVDARLAGILVAVFAVLAIGRGAAFERLAADHTADVAGLSAVLAEVPEGARLLPLRTTALRPPRTDWHLQAHAVIQSHAFVPTLFRGAHALKIDPRWIDATAPQAMSIPANYILGEAPAAAHIPGMFWTDWRATFTHVLALDNLGALGSGEDDLTLIARVGRFELYAIAPASP